MMGGKETWASVVFKINGDGPADGVAGGGARRTCPLGLKRQCKPLICFSKKIPSPKSSNVKNHNNEISKQEEILSN